MSRKKSDAGDPLRGQATVGSAEQAFELEAVGAMEDDELANLGAFSLTHAGVQCADGEGLAAAGVGEGVGRALSALWSVRFG